MTLKTGWCLTRDHDGCPRVYSSPELVCPCECHAGQAVDAGSTRVYAKTTGREAAAGGLDALREAKSRSSNEHSSNHPGSQA